MGIQIKHKKCSSIGKALGFKGCGKLTLNRKFGLCMECYPKFLMNDERGKIIMHKAMQLGKSKVKKESVAKEKEKTKKMRENVKTLSQHEAEAKKVFQLWIRKRDEGKNCISCNKPTSDPAGGHFYPAGIYSGLMFNPDNCHLQCNTNCNKHLSGNLLEYRKGLINRYGIEFVGNLDKLSNELRNYKYTKEELTAIKNKYLTKIKNKDHE